MPLRDSTEVRAVARASIMTPAGNRIGVAIIRPSQTDVDYAVVFVKQCASRPVLRGTGWVPQLTAEPVQQWNRFMSRVDGALVPTDTGTAKALGLLFLSFGTGRFVAIPSDLAESGGFTGQSGDEIVPVEVRDVRATCVEAKCRVSGVWVPAPGGEQRFWVLLNGLTVDTAILEKHPGAP